MATKSERNILIENPQSGPKVASVALPVGMWLEYIGGFLNPLTPATGIIEGLNLTPIASTDTDYASNKEITYDTVDDVVDRFLMPVTNGSAGLIVGQKFNVYTDSFGLNVANPTLVYNTLAVSSFAAGHVVQVTSAAGLGSTATVVTDNGSTTMTFKNPTIIGTGFAVGATLLDLTSGATAVVGTAPVIGVQFEVTRVLSTTLVEVKVIKTK